MRTRLAAAAALALASALTLTGCFGGPPAAPAAEPGTSTDASNGSNGSQGATDNGDNGSHNGAPEIDVDPAWPWPSNTPRPKGQIVYEMSMGNILGEGGIWELRFHASSLEEVEAYVEELKAAGWDTLFGSGAMVEDNTAAWSIVKEDVLGAISTDDLSASPIEFSFSFMGKP